MISKFLKTIEFTKFLSSVSISQKANTNLNRKKKKLKLTEDKKLMTSYMKKLQ